MHAHQRAGEHAVEAGFRLTVAPDTYRHAVDAHYEDAAERIARGLGGIDRGDHLRFGGFVGIADVARLDVVLRKRFKFRRDDVADAVHVAARADPERFEKLCADGAEAHAHRRLSRARTLEHIAQIALTILQRTGVVGVTGTGIGEGFTGAGNWIHQRAVVLVVAVAYHDRNRRAECFAPAHAGEKFDFVALDFHALAATVPALAACQGFIDPFDVEVEMRGQPVEDTDERRSVGFARR